MSQSQAYQLNHPLFTPGLAAAIRAPSPHNTQPWRFEVDDDQLDLWLDRSRVLNVADPDAREARLSCGAALFNLVTSIHAQGKSALVKYCPQRSSPDLLATIQIDGNQKPTHEDHKLAKAIFQRHTNRGPFFDQELQPAERSALKSAAAHSGGALDFLDPSGRYDAVAELIRRAEFFQSSDSKFRAETARWTGKSAQHFDGVPLAAASPPPVYQGAVALRESHTNMSLPSRSYEQQPLLAALLFPGKGVQADLRAGAAMQHVLLTATSLGLATSFLSQPFETLPTRTALERLFRDQGTIHTLLRIGYAHTRGLTPRRSIAEVSSRRTQAR